MRVSFGEFLLDTAERRLFAGDREVHLSPKAFELLVLLIEQRPRALGKAEIFERLWPATFVTENTLAIFIADLRTTLGDDARRPRLIGTVYGFGYAFAGAAAEEPGGAAPAVPKTSWRVFHEGRQIRLGEGDNILGRAGSGIVVIDSPTISRQHARLVVSGQRATIEDLGSKNGTWVGHTPVTGPTEVKDGDELRLGSVVLAVRHTSSAPSTETIPRPLA